MEKRIVYAPVLVPDKPDHDGDTVTVEQIEEFAHKFMASYRNIDLQHTLNNIGVPVESFISKGEYKIDTPEGEKILPAGTWIMAVKVLHEDTWNRIKEKQLTGFSIMAVKRTVLDGVVAKSTTFKEDDLVAIKSKTTLKDLGEDLEVVFVSIVDEPAVPDATFFTIKNKEKSFMDKLRERVNKAFVSDSGTSARKEEADMTEEELKALLETIQTLNDKVAALEAQAGEAVEGAEKAEEDEEVEDAEEVTEVTEEAPEATEAPAEEAEVTEANLQDKVAQLEATIEELKSKTVAKSKQLKGSDFKEEETQTVVKSKFERDSFGNRIGLKY